MHCLALHATYQEPVQFTIRGDRTPIDHEPLKTPEAWAMEDGVYVCENLMAITGARRAIEGTADSPMKPGKRPRKSGKVLPPDTLY